MVQSNRVESVSDYPRDVKCANPDLSIILIVALVLLVPLGLIGVALIPRLLNAIDGR